jgi:hypothetical protein
LTDRARDRAIRRNTLHKVEAAAKSRLDCIERDVRRCSDKDVLRKCELKGERTAWANIHNMVRCEIVRLRDDDGGSVL